MKITKRVEEYIRTKIADKYNYIGKDERAAFEEDKKKFEAFCKKTLEEMNQKARDEFPNIRFSKDDNPFYYSSYSITYDSYVKMNEKYEERNRKINDRVSEIIISMELGGTKDDLDRMLNED